MVFKTSFFKYVTEDSAIKILESSHIKFSSPAELNDPFDMSIDSIFAYDPIEQLHEMEQAFGAFLFGNSHIELDDKPEYGIKEKTKLIQETIASLSESKRNEMYSHFQNHRNTSYDVNRLQNTHKEVLEEIQLQFASDAIFCASLDPSNLLLWSHYANQHSGVVLEFKPNIDKDSIFTLLRNVQYSNKRPVLYESPSDFVYKALGARKNDVIRKYLNECTFTKSPEWEYEKEVRVSIAAFLPKNCKYKLLRFHEDELVGLYFGCRTNVDAKEKLLKLANMKYPQIKKFTMAKHSLDFRLNIMPC